MAEISITITLLPGTTDEILERLRERILWNIDQILKVNNQENAIVGSSLTLD